MLSLSCCQAPKPYANQQPEATMRVMSLTYETANRKRRPLFQAPARRKPAVRRPAPIKSDPPVRLTIA
jgi:hypothetical protein